MALTRQKHAALEKIMNERHAALRREIAQDVARSRDEVYTALAGPVSDTGDKAVADLISDVDNAELTRDLQELREIEAAQERLAKDSFGLCIDCGGEIDFERLRAYPAALRCFDCQSVYEKSHARAPEPKL